MLHTKRCSHEFNSLCVNSWMGMCNVWYVFCLIDYFIYLLRSTASSSFSYQLGTVMLCGWEGNRRPGGSLRPGGWLIVTCRLTACTLVSTPGPTLGNEYGKPLPLYKLYRLFLVFLSDPHTWTYLLLWVPLIDLIILISAPWSSISFCFFTTV